MSNPSYGNWLGILKWSLAQQDNTAPSDFRPMSEEDKKWLADAFENISVDEAKRMGEIAEILLKSESSLPIPSSSSTTTMITVDQDNLPDLIQDKLDALDELEGIVESIDNAKNLFIIGGFDPLLDCIRSSLYTELRWRACDVFSVVVQNNPKAQAWALQHSGCLTVICNALHGTIESSSSSSSSSSSLLHPTHTPGTTETQLLRNLKLQASALTALSALVRDNKEGQQRLVKRGDLTLVMGPIHDWLYYTEASQTLHHQTIDHVTVCTPKVQKAGKRLIRKALFFLRYLVTGAEADMVMSWILNYPSKPGLLPSLLSILSSVSGNTTTIANDSSTTGSTTSSSSSTSNITDDGDSQDARENILYILQSLLSPTVSFEGIDASTDSDHRKPRSLLTSSSPNLTVTSSSSSSETPLLLLGPSIDSSSNSDSNVSTTTTASSSSSLLSSSVALSNTESSSTRSSTIRPSLSTVTPLQRNTSYPTTITPPNVQRMDMVTRTNILKVFTDTLNDTNHQNKTVTQILQQHIEWLNIRIGLTTDEKDLYENERFLTDQVRTLLV